MAWRLFGGRGPRLTQLFNRSGGDGPKAPGPEPLLKGQPPTVSPGMRLYVIGDIHGRADLLEKLHDLILTDHKKRGPADDPVIIYLGDYVDRGPLVREVLDTLLGGPPKGFRCVYLKGNHEEMLQRFLDDPTYGLAWRDYGGMDTLKSYGTAQKTLAQDPMAYDRASALLALMIPPEHLDFLKNLSVSATCGDYFFSHAGVRPGLPVDEQAEEDLIWIREPFLSSENEFGKIIVHGHSPGRKIQIRKNRIGIDTGAWMSGVLTCMGLEGTDRWFLQTPKEQKEEQSDTSKSD